MLKKVAFTMYPVADVPRARKFYEESLGLTPGLVGNQGENYWVEYDLPGGGCFALTNFTSETPSDAAGGTIAFEVDDLDKLIADLEAGGTTFKSDLIHGPNCRMSVCLDTEGNSILLHQLNAK
ncbi:MAG: VOC family protein [Luteimonas sp.]|nr:VOC family protein [Luteimonas sp.]